MRLAIPLLAIFAAAALAFSATPMLQTVNDSVFQLCFALKTLLPVIAMLMVIVAAVIYAAGQMMGAETRARAVVWATASVVGALIAILIVVIAPAVLTAILGQDVAGACQPFAQ